MARKAIIRTIKNLTKSKLETKKAKKSRGKFKLKSSKEAVKKNYPNKAEREVRKLIKRQSKQAIEARKLQGVLKKSRLKDRHKGLADEIGGKLKSDIKGLKKSRSIRVKVRSDLKKVEEGRKVRRMRKRKKDLKQSALVGSAVGTGYYINKKIKKKKKDK